jgi:hypothetical protein
MNVLLKIYLPDGNEIHKTGVDAIVGGEMCSGGMSTPKFSFPSGEHGEFQAAGAEITLPDPEIQGVRHFRDDVAGDNLSGVLGEFYEIDASDPDNLAVGDKIWGGFIESWTIGNQAFGIKFSNQTAEMTAPMATEITGEEFPGAPDYSVNGRFMFRGWGNFNHGSKGTVICPRVSVDANAKYIITPNYDWPYNWSYYVTLHAVYTPDGTDVTASCSKVTRNPDSPEGAPFGTYINYSGADEDYLIADVSMYETYTTFEGDIPTNSPLWIAASSQVMGVLRSRGFDVSVGGGIAMFSSGQSPIEFLDRFCRSLGVVQYASQYGSDEDSIISAVIQALDFSDLTTAASISAGQILGSPQWIVDPAKGENVVTINFKWSEPDGGFTRNRRVKNKWAIAQCGRMQRSTDIDAHFLNSRFNAFILGKYWTFIHGLQPPARAELQVTFTGDDLLGIRPGDLVNIEHPAALGSGSRLQLVESVRDLDPVNGMVTLSVRDVEHFLDLDPDQVLVIPCEHPNGSKLIEDWAVGMTHEISNGGGVAHTTAQKPTGAESSLDFDGTTSGYLQMLDPNGLEKLDILSNTTWMLCVKIRRTVTGTAQIIFQNNAVTSGVWDLRFQADNTLRFRWNSGGGVSGNIDSVSTITDTSWHDVILFRNGDVYAIYLDGAQEAYRSGAITGILSGTHTYYMGLSVAGLAAFTGQMYWPAIILSNPLDLAPDSGLTDTAPALGMWRPTGRVALS